MTAWLICVAVAAVLGLAVWGLAKASSHEMPSPPPPDDRPWQPDPALLARCPGCNTLRHVADGLIVAHDRPQEWVPFDQASARCFGTGLPPQDTGGGRGPFPRTASPPSPGKDSEAMRPHRVAAEETVTPRDRRVAGASETPA